MSERRDSSDTNSAPQSVVEELQAKANYGIDRKKDLSTVSEYPSSGRATVGVDRQRHAEDHYGGGHPTSCITFSGSSAEECLLPEPIPNFIEHGADFFPV